MAKAPQPNTTANRNFMGLTFALAPIFFGIILSMKLIVGLGNPGVEYRETRHNLGFMTLDYYANNRKATPWQQKTRFNALVSELQIADEKVLLVKPTTYYNLVGEAIQKIRRFYRIDLCDLLVIHDEMALPMGVVRTRRGGSDAGNNGVRNIVATNGSEFARVRVGSGLTPTINGDTQPANDRRSYVLGRLTVDEQKMINSEQSTIADVIDDFVRGKFIETTYRH